MMSAYLLGGSIAALLVVVMVVALVVPKVRYVLQRKALEQILERYYQSGLAFVRYVMLNRQGSEEAAYQRLALFVKNHVPFDDQGYVESMLAQDRQSLVDRAREIVVHDPDELDEI